MWRTAYLCALLTAGLAAALSAASTPPPAEAQTADADTPADGGRAPVHVMAIEGVIGPAIVLQLEEALDVVRADNGQLLVIEIDTPGGLDESSREIVQQLISAPVPVVIYVAPAGARAASAGTYILYAAHVAAMAPATSIGAATPVMMNQPPPPTPTPRPSRPARPAGGDEAEEDGEAEPAAEQPLTTMDRKMRNDAVAHIRGLAELRGRNADWAEQAVRSAVSASATEALELGAIDLIADSREELLQQLDGRRLEVQGGAVELAIAGAPVVWLEPSYRVALLRQIASPEVASLLMGLGITLIPLEFFAGTGGIAALVGVVLLLIGAYGLSLLPLAYSGFAMALVGLLLIGADVALGFSGVLTLAGVVLAGFGGFLLYDIDPGYWAWGLTGTAVPVFLLLSATLFVGAVLGTLVWAERGRRTRSGAEILLGREVEVQQDFRGRGWVSVGGERWRGSLDGEARAGERLYVVGRKGLLLELSRQPPAKTPPPDIKSARAAADKLREQDI